MVLAQGEKILKSWDYSTSLFYNATTSNLTVTNKRIISSVKGKYRGEQKEILLKDAKGISFVQGMYRTWLSWVFIILGSCLILVSLFFAFALGASIGEEEEAYGIWSSFCICLIIGIPLIAIGIMRMFGGVFGVLITVAGKEGTPLSCGAVGLLGRKIKLGGGLIVKVDHDVAEKIVDYLGSIILENKE